MFFRAKDQKEGGQFHGDGDGVGGVKIEENKKETEARNALVRWHAVICGPSKYRPVCMLYFVSQECQRQCGLQSINALNMV